MQKKLIVGNWKMNPRSLKEARTLFLAIKKEARTYKKAETVIAPPFIYLLEASKITSASLGLAAQNVSFEKEGAFTGEISASMLSGAKVKYCIVGHSERRALGDTNEQINQKIKLLLANKITPILCVGELERDGEMWYLGTVKTQVEEALAGISKSMLSKIVIAYEPVWAISSTQNRRDATPEDFEEMQIYIKKILADMYGHAAIQDTRILYGGSVDEKNAGGFLAIGADGLLPGRASLTAKKFIGIIKTAHEIR